jgi:hypothetical protein
VLEKNLMQGLHHPENFHIGGNSEMTAKELHSPVGSWSDHARPVSPLVTDLNLRDWMRLVLECSDELAFNEFADVWMAVVQTEARLRVGIGGRGVLN